MRKCYNAMKTMRPRRDAYEVRPRKEKRGVDLISDVLPFGGLVVREAG
jgi:hypothetical protein